MALRFDYVGSCNFFSQRRFSTGAPSSKLLYTSPSDVPKELLLGVSAQFDLYQIVAFVFKGLLTLTIEFHWGNTDKIRLIQDSTFIRGVNTDLYSSIVLPSQEGLPSRRRHIKESVNILALVYTTMIATHHKDNGGLVDRLLAKLEIATAGDIREWGLMVIDFFRHLLLEDEFSEAAFSTKLSAFIDSSMTINWLLWRDIKRALLRFFLYDPVCEGFLQSLLRRRVAVVQIYQ
jgi:hypothetical protein